MLTSNPDLDDKILHYVLLAIGFLAYQFVKAGLNAIGAAEWGWVQHFVKKRKNSGN